MLRTATQSRAYLQAEWPNFVNGGDIDGSVNKLAKEDLYRHLEAASKTVRMNGVFDAVTDTGLDWLHVELPIGALSLTGLNPELNKIIASAEIDKDPLKFAVFLEEYFKDHPDKRDDPRGLNVFRPVPNPHFSHTTLMTVERDGRIDMLDGTHRLMGMILSLGATSIKSYAGVPNGQNHESMLGDGQIEAQRKLYVKANDTAIQESIIAVCVEFCLKYRDAAEAVQRYWIDHQAHNPALQTAGRTILDRYEAKKRMLQNRDDLLH